MGHSDGLVLPRLIIGDQSTSLFNILIQGDGLHATKDIGRVAPETAIVVHSADEHRPTVLAHLLAGAIYHVRAGIDVPDLVHLLLEAMDAHRS